MQVLEPFLKIIKWPLWKTCCLYRIGANLGLQKFYFSVFKEQGAVDKKVDLLQHLWVNNRNEYTFSKFFTSARTEIDGNCWSGWHVKRKLQHIFPQKTSYKSQTQVHNTRRVTLIGLGLNNKSWNTLLSVVKTFEKKKQWVNEDVIFFNK